MADGNLILNVDFSSGPAEVKAPKFTGGRWRDRKRAEREYKRQNDGQDRPAKRPRVEASQQTTPRRWGAGGGAAVAETGRRRNVNAEAPSESTADSDDKAPPAAATAPPAPMGPSAKHDNGNVTSRLFTANPTPLTDFTANDDNESSATVAPSNAPLSAEAASFAELGLARRIATHLATKMGIQAPTAIQKAAVPQLLGDSDVFLQSETGSGKTLTYLLPIVQRIVALSEQNDGTKKGGGKKQASSRISRSSGLFAVVLAPTRELSLQIARVLERLLGCTPWLVSTAVIGGESRKAEKARFRKGVNILVATPGRLVDHLENTEALDFAAVRWLVLDEGDQLMDLGFEEDIKKILAQIRQHPLPDQTKDGTPLPAGVLPARRVTMLCSATMKMNVQKLGEISLEDAIHVTAPSRAETTTTISASGNSATAADSQAVVATPLQLKQSCLVVPAKLRLVTLIALLRSVFMKKGAVNKVIVFLSCTATVNFHFDLLRSPAASDAKESAAAAAPAAYITSEASREIDLHKLHGNMEAKARADTLQAFKRQKKPAVLLTTDVAARGLDVEDLDLVVEYDPAMSKEVHEHRIGRTARAGRAGKAVLFLLPGCEEGYIPYLQQASDLTIAAQPFATILQRGFATPVDLAAATPAATAGGGANIFDDSAARQSSWRRQAEALQLHLEQRVLRSGGGAEAQFGKSARDSKGSKHHGKAAASAASADSLMDAARHAFNSHIRAYATHDSRERAFFDKNALHKGHMAKSFALRMSPRAIGATAHVHQPKKAALKAKKSSSSSKKHSGVVSGANAVAAGSNSRKRGPDIDNDYGSDLDDSDDDGAPLGWVDQDAMAARMKAGLQNLNSMNEFNIA